HADAGREAVEIALELVLLARGLDGRERERRLLELGPAELGAAGRAEPGILGVLMSTPGAEHGRQATRRRFPLTTPDSTSTRGSTSRVGTRSRGLTPPRR